MIKETVMSNKIEISQKVDELYEHKRSLYPTLKLWQSEFEQEVIEKAKELKPKTPKMDLTKATKVVSLGIQQEIFQPYKDRAKEYISEHNVKTLKLEQELEKLAKEYVFPQDMGDTWSLYKSSSTYDYQSQGYGSKFYAKGALQPSLQHLASLGLETEVKWILDRFNTRWGIESGYFELWVRGDTTDVEIAKRKPGITLKQAIKVMEEMGRNPRVYFPFLPYDV
jgi:hypothetical protein